MTDVIKANGWKVFMVLVAVLTALGSHLGAFPWLPGWAQHAIEFCSFVASVIVAVLIDPTKVVPPPTITEIRSGSAKIGCLVAAVLGAGLLVSSCASGSALQRIVTAETVSVQAVHLVIHAEEDAYHAQAFSPAQHQKNIAALQKVVASEHALNDALRAWNASGGQPMPGQVAAAVQALAGVLADLQPVIGSHPQITRLVSNLATAIVDLTKGLV